MSFKVKREGTGSVCDTCRYAHILRGKTGQQVVFCGQIHDYLAFPVEDCSTYSDKRKPSVYEMEELAWVLITEARHGRNVGFISPKDRKAQNIDVGETPGFY